MPWLRKRYKDYKVYVWCDSQGRVVLDGGLARIKYSKDDDREYTARREHIKELDFSDAQFVGIKGQQNNAKIDLSSLPIPKPVGKSQVVAYTDGASRGNPGDAACAAVLLWDVHLRDIAHFLGTATNNVAELKAVELALTAIRQRHLPVVIYTDSTYVQGVLLRGWKARANKTLIERIKSLMRQFASVQIRYVEGHSGIAGNERADKLCNIALNTRRNIDNRITLK